MPLKGSIEEPNLPSKNLLQPYIDRTRCNLNHTWGSGGISSICRFPVSSTFSQKSYIFSHDTINLIFLVIMIPSTRSASSPELPRTWEGRRDKPFLFLHSHQAQISSTWFRGRTIHIQRMKKGLKNCLLT